MFNEDQRDHMRSLAAIPPAERCWCGWGRAGACDTPSPCPHDLTLADRISMASPCCGFYPPSFEHWRGSHFAGCTAEFRRRELEVADIGGEA